MTEPTTTTNVLQPTDRDNRGRFAQGWAGGPGRPPRATEVVYMRALSDVLTLDAWRDICEAAINSARDGDAKAREWVARYALGDTPTTLHALAVMEAHDLQPIDLVEAEADIDNANANSPAELLNEILGSRDRPPPMIAAIRRRDRDVAARQAEADRAERQARAERRAAARAAAKATTTQVVDVDPEATTTTADQ